MKVFTLRSLLLILFFCTAKLNAQTIIDTSTTQKLLQYIFQPVDKSQVPTGFLEEYGCPILPMATFNGTLSDSNLIEMNLWRTLYLQLQTGYCQSGTNPLQAITAVNSTIKLNTSSTLPVPIPLLIGQYNTVKSNAFTSNLLSYNAGTRQVFDVPGRTQSPYQLNNLFAASPNREQTITGSETFVWSNSLVWNNTGKSISQVQIDFKNGAGFQTLAMGTPFTVSYTDTGTKRWIIKVTLSDNSVMQCYSDYYVVKASNVAQRFTRFAAVVPAWGVVNAVAGVHSGGTIQVVYSNRNFTGTLRKPLIIVEGYDVSSIAPNLQNDYTVADFIAGINETNAQGYDFNNQLDDIAGYDLVFLNFNNGTDDIVRNAAVVQEVINRVNANKVNDTRPPLAVPTRQQNVVMGLSMGGLCARYALANMTKNFAATPTEARLLITHDSPHKGANIPLGLQYLIRMMSGFKLFGYDVYSIYPDYDEALNLLNAAATQQLLLYRSVTANTFAANTWLDATYRPMVTFGTTGPQPTYRFVATAQGNECARARYNPGKTFINLGAGIQAGIKAKILFFKVPIVSYKLAAEVEAYALPNTGSTAKIARLYTENSLKLFGFIYIFKQLYNNTAFAPGNHLPIDGVPGSSSPLLDFAALQEVSGLPQFNVSLYVSFPLGPIFSGYFGIYAYNAGVAIDFTFVPVASALDASPYDNNVFSQRFVNGVNQSYPPTPETFIAQESVVATQLFNNVHLAFTPRNARFLFNEMENLANLENCSAECTNPFYLDGPNEICTSGTYRFPGLQRGVTFSWTVSQPFTIVNQSGTGTTITLTRNGTASGVVTLTANVGAGCGPAATYTRTILVGSPQPFAIGFDSQEPLCIDQRAPRGVKQAYVSNGVSGVTYQWQVNNVTRNGTGPIFNIINSWCVNGTNTVRVRSLRCGVWSAWTSELFEATACGARQAIPATPTPAYTLSPNPVTDRLNIQSKANLPISEIRVKDKTGGIRQQLRLPMGTVVTSLNLGALPADVYVIEIFDGKQWISEKVIKN